jgi:hypothetical protein
MRNIDILREVLKKTAREIRGTRYQFKEAQRNRKACGTLRRKLHDLQYEFRHHHIAYCELRGRTRDEIEEPNDNHYPNERYIQQLNEKYAWSEEEIALYQERKAKVK